MTTELVGGTAVKWGDGNVSMNKDKDTKSDGENGNTERPSSFYLLNKNNDRIIPQIKVTLEDITYQPITSTGGGNNSKNRDNSQTRTLVLDKINTQINPYELSAWMGPSGSGKTSLTQVVAGLVDPQDITGSIKVNNSPGQIPKHMVGVVWQDDLLLSNLTVEETIFFAARLKSPCTTSEKEVNVLVEETMKELGLLHLRNSIIGSSTTTGANISGGERKRTAVAVELVVRPSLLVCDEPTSGLDATTSLELIKTFKDLTSLGHSIAIVIHQPRTDIFNLIDRLLLLSKGRIVYDGKASMAKLYLEKIRNVKALPPETGIADWIMDTIIGDEKDNKTLADHWAKSRQINIDNNTIETSNNNDTNEKRLETFSSLADLQKTRKNIYQASFRKELSMLTNRIAKQQRGEKLTRVSLLLSLTYLIFTSFMWWRMPNNTAYVFERNSLLFFVMIAQGAGIVNSSISVFNRERALLRRERAKKMYRVLPFFLAKAISDMTNNIALPVTYGIITYWTAGLRPSLVPFFKFVLGYSISLNCAQSLGFFISMLIPNMAIALMLASPITLFCYILAGFYIPVSSMHVAMKWLSYFSFARYGYSALLINEFEGRFIPCAEDHDSGISVGNVDECPLPGDSVYESIGISGIFANYWFNIVILAIFQLLFMVGAYVLLRRSKGRKVKP